MTKDDLKAPRMDERPESLDDDQADVYNLLRRVENLAAETDFSAHQMNAIEGAILDSVTETETQESWSWVNALRLFVPTAAAACALLIFVALPGAESEWQARGTTDLRAGVTAQCVSPEGELAGTTSVGAQLMHGSLACAPGDLVAFSANNLGTLDLHLMVLALSGDAFEFVTDKSVLVAAGTERLVLEDAARAGDLEVVVLFFEQPTSAHVLRAQLSDAQARAHLSAAAKLPVPALVQARVDVEVR